MQKNTLLYFSSIALTVLFIPNLSTNGPRSDIRIDTSQEITVSQHINPYYYDNKERNIDIDHLKWRFNEHNNNKSYEITVIDTSNCSEEKVGNINFYQLNEPGYYFLSYLWVEKNFRNQHIGQKLFQAMIHILKQYNAVQVEWTAAPFDLHTYQKKEELLPRLIKFYENLGGKVVDLISSEQAHMMLTLV